MWEIIMKSCVKVNKTSRIYSRPTQSLSWIRLLYFQEVLTYLYSKLLYEIGQDFLGIHYNKHIVELIILLNVKFKGFQH